MTRVTETYLQKEVNSCLVLDRVVLSCLFVIFLVFMKGRDSLQARHSNDATKYITFEETGLVSSCLFVVLLVVLVFSYALSYLS